ncbi:MAG: AMP-binding protein [Treponema sp.]|nr:AMP-binding protein [Treponema sp.]
MIQLREKTLISLCLAASLRYKNRTAFAMLSGGKNCRRVTYLQMGIRARQFGSLFREIGVKKGAKVLLLSENCPEWPLAYFGIAFAGAVSVPMLTGFSAEQTANIAVHCDVSAVCLGRSMLEKFKFLADIFARIPIIVIDSISPSDDIKTSEITVFLGGAEKIMPLRITEEDTGSPPCEPYDLATIIYTSGTAGNSKGVMLCGANIISSALSSLSFVKLYPRDRLLSVLPLAHSYESCIGLLAPVMSGASVTYLDRPPSPSVLLPAFKTLRPTAIITVPLFIEKMYHNAIAPKLNDSKLYKFPLTRRAAVQFSGRRLKSAMGGKLRFFGIGGAPLSAEVENFLRSAGFPYSTGYGLTEAAPLVTGNRPRRFPVRSMGKAPQNVKLRISGYPGSEGEIQVKGPNVMMGYFNDSGKTAEAFTEDGWLRTGDLGSIDKKGWLSIKGRIKAMILGPSGENIYPEEIEGLLGSSSLVEDALVYSGKKGELVALVRLSDAAKAAAGALENALEELRAWVNKKLASFSKLNRIEIQSEPFEKTPTMKIKRYLYV